MLYAKAQLQLTLLEMKCVTIKAQKEAYLPYQEKNEMANTLMNPEKSHLKNQTED